MTTPEEHTAPVGETPASEGPLRTPSEWQKIYPLPTSVFNELFGREPGRSVPTPWSDLDDLVAISGRRKVGIVAHRGSREARIGRDIAMHAAESGLSVVLFTLYPPATRPKGLRVDETAELTPRIINAYRREEGCLGVDLVVIERIERLKPDPIEPRSDYDYEPDDTEELSWGDQLMEAGRRISVGVPVLMTTVVDPEPATDKRLSALVGIDHPAMVMTDICQHLLVVRRVNPLEVAVRFETDYLEYRTGETTLVPWEPLRLP